MTLSESVSIFTINDFPTEIIEMFAPNHSTSTLITLRSVSKRFYNVFSQDKFWKQQILLYSEKRYLCDLLSHSVVKSVKDVLEDIADGNISELHGFHRLDIAHTDNWLTGPPQSIDTIDLLPSSVSFTEEIVDDENEWWLFLSVGKYIHIWNLTSKPYSLKPVYIGSHSKIKIIPGVKIIVFNKNDGLVTVYKFNKLNISLHNKFVYYMNSNLDSPQQPTARCRFTFIVTGTYLIGYNRKISSYRGDLLHVWNLETCNKIASVSLSELDCNYEFQQLVSDYSTGYPMDITVSCKGCKIDLFPCQYPNVMVCLKYPRDRLCVVSVFNMDMMRVSHFIDNLTSDIIGCSINCDIVSVVATSHVINYTIRRNDLNSLTYGEQFTYIECVNINKNNILFKNSNMFIKEKNEVNIVSLINSALSTKTVEVDPSYSILAFLEPNILLMYDYKNPTKTDIKVYFVPSGKEIFVLKNVNIGHKFLDYYWHLSYPSKLLLNFNEGYFKVLNF